MSRKSRLLAVSLIVTALGISPAAQQPPRRPDLAARARAALAQHAGTIMLTGLKEPVEVLRDQWGIPHIYARSTEDLFFAQGYIVAQDRMWQLEMWRRNGEGKLAEILGPEYVTRDRFARLLAYRGNWDEEFRKYHPEGRKIFDAFARGINASIQKAIDENKIPVEFEILGFRPQPVWTAKTVLTRMPGWTLSRNAASEVTRALDIKAMGLRKVEELKPTEPPKKLAIPEGLDLEDIEPAILDVTRGANNIRWSLKADLGSNNWVVGPSKSATGAPILANDPHREVVNPALRHVVHLEAPGWSAIGGTEPGLPGISIGHNDRLAWGFTILGMDQQDLYVEETHAEYPNTYLYKGQWLDMQVERQLIFVKGRPEPVEIDLKFTRHGPVLYENPKRHRAFALKWVGAEAGGAGYLGSLNVMQAKSWQEFNDALPKAWYIPSHSLVYADVEGNYGYVGVAWTPVRKNWDGLLPVPGKDGRYEWDGAVPFDKLPKSLNSPRGFYNSSNNDVVPKIVPSYNVPLGYEYSAAFRYDRVFEVLSAPRKFSVADMEQLQQDKLSLPARELVPLLRKIKTDKADVKKAIDTLLSWNAVLDRESVAATIYDFWILNVMALAHLPRIPEAQRGGFRQYDITQALGWMKSPDEAYGRDTRARTAERDRILVTALEQALADIRTRAGDDMSKWKWGDLHTADFIHPLATDEATRALFRVEPVRRGGDGFTVQAASSVTETSTKQTSGASFMFVLDTKDWDRSTALSTPGNSAQPLSPHFKDLAPLWGEAKYFPLAFSRRKVEEVTKSRLTLQPIRDTTLTMEGSGRGAGASSGGPAEATDGQRFEPVQPDLFSIPGAQANPWADFDNDGDLDLYVGFRGQLSRLYRNDGGTFVDVADTLGLADGDEVRAAAWGDYNGDGNIDLYVGFARGAATPNKLYRNDGDGKKFTEVAREVGLAVWGTTRQPAWVDYDQDGDVDLFVAFRDRPNMLFKNDQSRFTDVAPRLGLNDPRKTVGAVWFDMDHDGDLDVFVANQDGDTNGFFRNDGAKFVDVAPQLGMDGAGRPPVHGGVGPSLADYDNDGDLDLYLANYGPNTLYRNEGGGTFTEVAADLGVAGDYHATASSWGDYDNDGLVDLYVGTYLANITNVRDYLYRNLGNGFADVTPAVILKHDATHGVQWADFDQDGDLDLALADNGAYGTHYLFRNHLAQDRRVRSVQVMAFDERGRSLKAGSEVRVFKAGTRRLLGTRIVDTGSGYCSQNAMAVHVGLPADDSVDVEVTDLSKPGRRVTRVANVNPRALAGKPLIVKVGAVATSSSR